MLRLAGFLVGPTTSGQDAIRTRLTHAEQRARHEIDALRRLVAGQLELEHVLHLAQALHAGVRAAQLVAELDRFHAQAEVQNEGRSGRQNGQRPQDQEHPFAAHQASSPQLGSLGASASTRIATRSLALRARGFSASSVSLAKTGFLFKRCQEERSRNARLTKRSSSE